MNIRVLPRVARIRHHAFAAHLRAQHRIVSTEATRGGNNLAHDGARGKLEESRCTVLQPTGASQFGQCGHVPPALHGLCGPSLLHCPGVLSSGQNVPGVPGCRIGHGQLFGSGAAATHSSARSSNLGRAACRTVVQPAGGFGPPVAAAVATSADVIELLVGVPAVWFMMFGGERKPGDFAFDPLGLRGSTSDEAMEVKELKHGRLAMLSFGAIITQAAFHPEFPYF